MLQKRIEQIGRIVRDLDPVEYPEDSPLPTADLAPPTPEPCRTGVPPVGTRARRPCHEERSDADLAALFAERLNALRAPGDSEPAVIRVADGGEAAAKVAELCRGVPAGEVLRMDAASPGPERRDHALGITPAAAIIASTGSIILALPRAEVGYASLLVDRHIVVASEDQLMPDLPAFYQRFSGRLAAGEKLPNHVCITGCSRTADIEKMLVVPAHGPRQMRVVLSRTPIDWALFLMTCDSVRPSGAAVV